LAGAYGINLMNSNLTTSGAALWAIPDL